MSDIEKEEKPERATVILFKRSGKYYTEETWRVPDDAIGPYDMARSEDFRTIDGGPVLVGSQDPWGFPHLITGARVTELDPTVSERGFRYFAPIETLYGSKMHVGESSLASQAAVWIHTDQDVSLHLSLDQARLIAGQLLFLAEDHYQEEGR